ncbi:MAG: bifunctional adenosylcobinamide kinase/adenosylcobinamide-phosphate guanylyltransferase [Granulosicoccus sp.]
MTVLLPPHRSLILGGVKSGKSRHAECLADACSRQDAAQVILIATATAKDAEMQQRIDRHKKERNKSWAVLEEPLALANALNQATGDNAGPAEQNCIVIDCLTLWVTNLLLQSDDELLRQEIDDFKQAVKSCRSRLIIVSNETNLGITPMGELSRRFCDETGLLHQALGQICEDVALMVAGIPMNIKKTGPST